MLVLETRELDDMPEADGKIFWYWSKFVGGAAETFCPC
jgi:hypothetical protein